ncbi:Gag-pol fusion protein [Phytophthora cinnamomi]|uniref:Gag-pol fusion protein n=2 Tax=Phytophthora cinnamomi TaxID=4785 RepID=UPI003559FE09|nr:Gag-pol fusion protein [Phytophthora cinnamomi]
MSDERLAELRRVADDAMKELDERKQQRAHDDAEGRQRTGKWQKAKWRAAAAGGTENKIAKSTAKAVHSAQEDKHQTEQVAAEPRDSEKMARMKDNRGDLLDVHEGRAVYERPQQRGRASEAGGGQPLEGGDDGQRGDSGQRGDDDQSVDGEHHGDDDRHETDAMVTVYGSETKLRDEGDERDQLPRRKLVKWANDVVSDNESDGQQNDDAAARRDDTGRHTGPLPMSADGQHYVNAALEYVTRYAVSVTVKQHTAENVAEFLMKHVVLKFGPFRELLTDGAPELTGKVIEKLVILLQAQ